MNASRKQLKVTLALRVRKLGPFFLVTKLGEFIIFDNFFLGLVNFWDLDKFWPFNFPDFLAISIQLLSLTLNLTISPLPFFTLDPYILDDLVFFSIKINEVVILLKPYINHQ